MLAVYGEGAVEYGLCLPECETRLQASSMGGWKLGLRAGWNGAAARRSRSAITRGGVGGLWMRDSRFPASVVAKFRIAPCNFRFRFGSARRAQNETAWRASYYFPLEKYIGNTTGTGAWKGSRVRQAVPILGPLLEHPCTSLCTRVNPYPRPARSTPSTRSV